MNFPEKNIQGFQKAMEVRGEPIRDVTSHMEAANTPEELALPEVLQRQILAAEEAVEKLGKKGNQAISEVEAKTGLASADVAVIREESQILEHLNQIRTRASELLWNFKHALRKKVDRSYAKREKEKEEYTDLRDYLEKNYREISKPLIDEARKRRNELLEGRGLFRMSKEDFQTYFSAQEFEIMGDLKQKNVGDCYAIAAIHALSRSPHFEMFCRAGMKKGSDGVWTVRIPLMAEHSRKIRIKPSEIAPQKNRRYQKPYKSQPQEVDYREQLLPVEANEGLQVLEAAFIKSKIGNLDRLSAEGGYGDDVLQLLGGENVDVYSLFSPQIQDKKTKKWEYAGLNALDPKNMAYLDHFLENFDPEIHVATVSTGPKDLDSPKFIPKHAYSISRVDIHRKIITVANPWDTAEPSELTFDEFKGSFSFLGAVKVNSAKLLSNMQRLEKKAA